jgi:exosortase/archaeosortase family protein
VGPLVLLALQTALLTPLVEFNFGWMEYLASPRVFNVLFLGVILFILLSVPDLAANPRPQRWQRFLFWLLTNVLAFYILLRYTLILEKQFPPQAIEWYHALGWLLLVLITGVAAWLAFIPASFILNWLKTFWHKAVGSILIAITFVIITPDIQSLWTQAYPSTIGIATRLMQFCGHDQVVLARNQNNPVLGIPGQGIPLTITESCAEMESLAMFVLIATVFTLAYWKRVRKGRMAVIVAGGLTLLYFLNAGRIVLLVEIAGTFKNPRLAVDLAHSRLSGVFFLGLILTMLIVSKPWWYQPQKDSTITAEP